MCADPDGPCPFTRLLLGAGDVGACFTSLELAIVRAAVQDLLDRRWQAGRAAVVRRGQIFWVSAGTTGSFARPDLESVVRGCMDHGVLRANGMVLRQRRGLAQGSPASPALCRVTCAYLERRALSSPPGASSLCPRPCRCGATHSAVFARWIDDVAWHQRVDVDVCAADWWADIAAVFAAGGLSLANTGIVDTRCGTGSVRWTDLLVWPSGSRVAVAQAASLASDHVDLPRPAPAGCLRWLRHGEVLVAMSFFRRLLDSGVEALRSWEPAAQALVGRGYAVRALVSAAAAVQRRRGAHADPVVADWCGSGVAARWQRRWRRVWAGEGDSVATLRRAIHEGAALVPRHLRRVWCTDPALWPSWCVGDVPARRTSRCVRFRD